MKSKNLFISGVILLLTVSFIFAGWGRRGQRGNKNVQVINDMVSQMPYEELSDAEKNYILKMREEEKLARDVYLTLYETWGSRVFINISGSEQTHMDAVKSLIDKYGLKDPLVNNEVGFFSDPKLKELYETLVSKGKTSITNAFTIGATIEDLDIYDLDEAILKADNMDVVFVFENLRKGSENHMRAFVFQLNNYGLTYTPQYISQEEFDRIISENSTGGHGYGRRNRNW